MSDGETTVRVPTVLDRADRARLVLEPFPHIVVENALPDEVYQALSSAFPPLSDLPSDLAGTNNKRFNLYSSWGPTELPKDQTPAAWQDFLKAHTSTDFVRKIFDLFSDVTLPGETPGSRRINPDSLGEGLASRLRLPETVAEEDIIARATVAINTPVATPTSVRGPHVDSLWKAYVGLYYVRAPGDNSTGGDLSLYRWKPGAKQDPWTRKADESLVEEFATIRYAPNTYVLMLNTHDSLHGVTVRQPTPHVRRFAVTSGWFPGVDEGSLLGRRRGIVERLKGLVRPLVAKPTVAEYQD
ncbi:MAG: 2OG-Fe(II) oxygenase [Caulobacter sp.]|nr:2OG-Fe(II) oxygenase [Caulobacter sp.]